MKKTSISIALFIATSMFAIGSANAAGQVKKEGNVPDSVVKAITASLPSVAGVPEGAVPDEVNASPVAGLYQVVYGTRILYLDATGQFVVQGALVNPKTNENLADQKLAQISKKYLSSLDVKNAVKQVNGNGSRVIYTFEDANCGYCKKLHGESGILENTTIYTFPVGFLGDPSVEKAKRILCTDKEKDRLDLWRSMMTDKPVPNGDSSCENGAVVLAKNGRNSQQLGVTGTPTLFFKDGTRITGYMPAAEIEKRLAAVK